MAYVKLSTSILDSSVWEQDPSVRITWITLLAMADQDGIVRSTAGGIARNAIIDLDTVKRALATFEAPDPDSRTSDHDGRRIAKVPGGWLVLNYERYRDENSADERKEKQRARQARYRSRQKAQREANAAALSAAGVNPAPALEISAVEEALAAEGIGASDARRAFREMETFHSRELTVADLDDVVDHARGLVSSRVAA